MHNHRSQSALSFCRAQVTLFFLSIMASLIVLAFIVIIVGKTAKDKTYADNAADAGALAACSIMAQGFNDNSKDNGSQQSGEREFEEGRQKLARDADENTNTGNHNEYVVKADFINNAPTPPGTSSAHEYDAHKTDAEYANLDQTEKNMEEQWRESQENDNRQRRNMCRLIS